jgi:phage portal protein BeeE
VSWWDRYVWRRTAHRQQLTLEQLLAEETRPVAAGVSVTTTSAMQHSAVWACVNLIAGSISTLPLAAYRRGERDPLPDLPPILRAPSAGWTLPDFLYAVLQSLLTGGNAYGLIVDRRRRPPPQPS